MIKKSTIFIFILVVPIILSGCKPKAPENITITSGSTPAGGQIVTTPPLEVPKFSIGSFYPKRGKVTGGKVIRIYGSGLTPDLSITIDGKKCELFKFLSPKELQCSTPPGTLGLKDLVIGDVVTFHKGFLYYDELSIKPQKSDMPINSTQALIVKGGGGYISIYLKEAGSGKISGYTYTAPNTPGVYDIFVSDEDGNSAQTSILVGAPLFIPNDVSKGFRVGQVYTFTPAGGKPPYQFSASRGVINQNGVYTAPSTNGEDIVTITDKLGEKSATKFYVFVPPKINPEEITLFKGETLTFFAEGELSPFKFSTDLGDIGLDSGLYTASAVGSGSVVVVDSAGNRAEAKITILKPLSINPSSITLGINKSAVFTASGGKPPYTFVTSKNLDLISVGEGLTYTALNPGMDTITVSDSLGKTAIATVVVLAELEISPKTISLAVNAKTNFTASGGSGEYLFSATNGNIDSKGVYTFPTGVLTDTVQVRDKNGEAFAEALVKGDFRNLWVALKKSKEPNLSGNYERENGFPGARFLSTGWKDKNGDLWLFGGFYSVTEYFNDLWKYNISSNQWTLINGSDVPSNFETYSIGNSIPGARYGASAWTDSSGSFWLFGGIGSSEMKLGYYNDLWKFDGNNWTLKKGVHQINPPDNANIPSPRKFASTWTDSNGDLWLFGGGSSPPMDGSVQDLFPFGVGDPFSTYGYFSDLWVYKNGNWEFVKGSKEKNNMGVTSGEAKNLFPGARHLASSWSDKNGNLWLFGGFSISSYLKDLWKFNIESKNWTLIENTGSVPSERYGAVNWVDSDGNFWLYGGKTYAESPYSYMSDLWKYNPGLNVWTKVFGTFELNQPVNYGTINYPSGQNTPGARQCSLGWTDKEGNLWLFGGSGHSLAPENPQGGFDPGDYPEGDSWEEGGGGYGPPESGPPGGGPSFGPDEPIKNDLWKFYLK